MLKRGLYFTDIHFGKKSNSEVHNQDCLNYLDWLCTQAREQDVDFIAFLGDWHENRNSINVSTLRASYLGAKKLNDLGIPVYMMVGNHDLFFRHSRDLHSIPHLDALTNIKLIDEVRVCKDVYGDVVFAPYLFTTEYDQLTKYNNVPMWAGHFEFQGFVVTGYNVTMPTGPDHRHYSGPATIASGHFHKRQIKDNVVYIGNTFPMDYGDSGDTNRGAMIYDHTSQQRTFLNWTECPTYIKTSLSDVLDGRSIILPQARVKCIADIDISYEESNLLRSTFVDKYNLREFALEEPLDVKTAISDTEIDLGDHQITETGQYVDVDNLIVDLFRKISVDKIDNEELVKIYQGLYV